MGSGGMPNWGHVRCGHGEGSTGHAGVYGKFVNTGKAKEGPCRVHSEWGGQENGVAATAGRLGNGEENVGSRNV